MTIGLVRPRQFIEPGLGVSTYFDFGARLFSTQWPTYGAHILQGLINLKLSYYQTKQSGTYREKKKKKNIQNIIGQCDLKSFFVVGDQSLKYHFKGQR